MQTEKVRAVFVSLINLIETDHRRLDELEEQVFALQGAVRGLDPTFGDVLKERAEETAASLEQFGPLRNDEIARTYQLIESIDLET